MKAVTHKRILGSQLSLLQPSNGYRVALDPILLAAAISAKPMERVFDVGSGTGAAALVLAKRLKGVIVQGAEIQEEYSELATKNALLNNFDDRVSFLNVDISRKLSNFGLVNFDHVMTNPPFIQASRGRSSNSRSKDLSSIESKLSLSDWLKICIKAVKDGGTVTLIHRADRLVDILCAIEGKLGSLTIFPIWSGRKGGDQVVLANRILIQGKKGSHSPIQLKSGLILRQKCGAYTERATSILNGTLGIDLAHYNS